MAASERLSIAAPQLTATMQLGSPYMAQPAQSAHWMPQEPVYSMQLYELIINQVHYYFSPENLARDEFLRGHMDPKEGWLPIQLLTLCAAILLVVVVVGAHLPTGRGAKLRQTWKQAHSEVLSFSSLAELCPARRRPDRHGPAVATAHI